MKLPEVYRRVRSSKLPPRAKEPCALCGGLDRECWMRFVTGFAEHDRTDTPKEEGES